MTAFNFWFPLGELRRATQITNWHRSGLSNGPTEAINNLVKRVKRIGFGFRRFRNYRIWALLYAGKPNWALLDTLTPQQSDEPVKFNDLGRLMIDRD